MSRITNKHSNENLSNKPRYSKATYNQSSNEIDNYLDLEQTESSDPTIIDNNNRIHNSAHFNSNSGFKSKFFFYLCVSSNNNNTTIDE